MDPPEAVACALVEFVTEQGRIEPFQAAGLPKVRDHLPAVLTGHVTEDRRERVGIVPIGLRPEGIPDAFVFFHEALSFPPGFRC